MRSHTSFHLLATSTSIYDICYSYMYMRRRTATRYLELSVQFALVPSSFHFPYDPHPALFNYVFLPPCPRLVRAVGSAQKICMGMGYNY